MARQPEANGQRVISRVASYHELHGIDDDRSDPHVNHQPQPKAPEARRSPAFTDITIAHSKNVSLLHALLQEQDQPEAG